MILDSVNSEVFVGCRGWRKVNESMLITIAEDYLGYVEYIFTYGPVLTKGTRHFVIVRNSSLRSKISS